eukprot:CAMPEP_0176429824 /NCGR_PEP_ID=MMETSP0127-20121128/13920_1 /TAXON_ID=938130 /ORGANISM="Platyophrya macrostoma, Strain WH" /LENGTH=75 /DNA_ID=CAMNT_0017811661 /DNA_START=48 /DNA_END=271 /DNA_ORIENTATION=+
MATTISARTAALADDACEGQLSQVCTVNSACRWCPAGAGGGSCVAANNTCDCSSMMANSCVGYEYCKWCPAGYGG